MIKYVKAKGIVGSEVITSYDIDSEELNLLGDSVSGLADAGVFSTVLNPTNGTITVEDTTNGDSATFLIVNTAATVATQLLGTQASFSASKDNASTINVYVETDGGTPAKNVVKVQNNSGGAIDLKIGIFSV